MCTIVEIETPSPYAQALREQAERVLRYSDMDFFRNRMFRQTLLCHGDAPARRELDDRVLERFAISSPVRPRESALAAREDAQGEQIYVTPEGLSLTTSEPPILAAMHALAQAWPAARGAGAPAVSSLLHASVQLEGSLEPRLLGLLDGTSDRASPLDELVSTTPSPEDPPTAVQLEQALERFASVGLLCS